MNDVLIEMDSRRRLSLGKLARPEDDRYLAHVEADGTIILTPAVVMSELEARLHANPELVERIKDQRKRPDEYRARPR